MSDHKAVVFCIDIESANTYNKLEHKAALYHKANLERIKDDLLDFQASFLESNPTLGLWRRTGLILRMQSQLLSLKMSNTKL